MFYPAEGICVAVAYIIYFAAIGAFYWALFLRIPKDHKLIIAAALIVIVVGPPTWFMIEYQCLLKPHVKTDNQLLTQYKSLQDVFRNLWLGIATLALATLAFRKDAILADSVATDTASTSKLDRDSVPESPSQAPEPAAGLAASGKS